MSTKYYVLHVKIMGKRIGKSFVCAWRLDKITLSMGRKSRFLAGVDGRENFHCKTFYIFKFIDHMNLLSILKLKEKWK